MTGKSLPAAREMTCSSSTLRKENRTGKRARISIHALARKPRCGNAVVECQALYPRMVTRFLPTFQCIEMVTCR